MVISTLLEELIMLSGRAALMVGAGLAAAPMVLGAARAEEAMDTTAAAPVDLSTLARIRHELGGLHLLHL